MFVIGETQSEVRFLRLQLPREYNLRRKNKKIYGAWANRSVLYLSDEKAPLKAAAGKKSEVFEVAITPASCIEVPEFLEEKKASITGCISTIKIEFDERGV